MSSLGPAIGRTLGFVLGWKGHGPEVTTDPFPLIRNGLEIDGTRYALRRSRKLGPTWIALHGIARKGRNHPGLQRFARALATSGATVIVPDVPEWRDLQTAPSIADDTTAATLRAIDADPGIDGSRIGLIGFSFGAPQAILAAEAPGVRGRIGSVAGFGGYADIVRTFNYMVTGDFEWGGERFHAPPDPYGRWIVAGNSIPQMPGYSDAQDVADAVLTLAREAGDRAIASNAPEMERVRVSIRSRVSPGHQSLFDLLAPSAGAPVRREEAAEMATALGLAAQATDPRLNPGPLLAEVRTPVHLIHGRNDRLIPFTETLRIASIIPHAALGGAEITGLFEHSRRADSGSARTTLREVPSFLNSLGKMLSSI